MTTIYKCTSDLCKCASVPAQVILEEGQEVGWSCKTCGAEYRYRQDPPPIRYDPSHIQNVRVAFKELSISEQVDCLSGILTEHAYCRGLSGLPKEFDLPPQDEIDLNYEDGVRHRVTGE